MAARQRILLITAMALLAAACGAGSEPSGTESPKPAPSNVATIAGAEPAGWHQRESMRVPRSEAPVAVLDERIYFAGGLSTIGRARAFDTMEVFDPDTNEWSTAAPMPARRHHLMVASHDRSVYVFGGLSERGWVPQNDTWRYDSARDSWEPDVNMPAAIGAGGAVTLGDSIFVIAGTGQPQAVFEFRPRESSWHERAPLPEPLEHFAVAALKGQIYVSGGRWRGTGESAAVYRYDPTSDVWSDVEPLDEARAGHAMAATGASLLVVGGELLESRTALASVEIYDPVADAWLAGPSLPRPTHGVAAAEVGATVYVVGGAPTAAQADALGEVYALVP